MQNPKPILIRVGFNMVVIKFSFIVIQNTFPSLKKSPVNCSPAYKARYFPTLSGSVNQQVHHCQHSLLYIIPLASSQNSIFPISLGQRLIWSTEALHLSSNNKWFNQVPPKSTYPTAYWSRPPFIDIDILVNPMAYYFL